MQTYSSSSTSTFRNTSREINGITWCSVKNKGKTPLLSIECWSHPREALNILRYEHVQKKRAEQEQRRLLMIEKVSELRRLKHSQMVNYQQNYFQQFLANKEFDSQWHLSFLLPTWLRTARERKKTIIIASHRSRMNQRVAAQFS